MFHGVAEMASHSSVFVFGFLATLMVGNVQNRYILADRDKEMIRQAVAASVIPVVTVDESGNITGFSVGATKLFGISSAEAVGQKMDLLVPERMQNDHWRAFTAAMQASTRAVVEARCYALRYVDDVPEEFPARLSIWTHPYHGAVMIARDEAVIKDLTAKETMLTTLETVKEQVKEVKDIVEKNREMLK